MGNKWQRRLEEISREFDVRIRLAKEKAEQEYASVEAALLEVWGDPILLAEVAVKKREERWEKEEKVLLEAFLAKPSPGTRAAMNRRGEDPYEITIMLGSGPMILTLKWVQVMAGLPGPGVYGWRPLPLVEIREREWRILVEIYSARKLALTSAVRSAPWWVRSFLRIPA